MKNLEETLGIVPMIDEHTPLEVSVEESDTPEDNDFNYARNNLYGIIEQGKIALNGALRVANENEKSRDFEVVGGLLERLSKINNQLLELNKQKVDIKTAKKLPQGSPTVPAIGTQNNVIVSSSADINKLLEAKLKQQNDT